MTIIGIESSALVASVAIAAEDKVVAEYTMNNQKTHSQTLLPMLDEIVRAAGIDISSVDAIAISRGPGSFTGLRIGSATAKGLGLALDKPLVEVPTLDALAYNLYGTGDALVVPIMDARRQEVYSGIYEFVPAGESGDGEGCFGNMIMRTVEAETAGPLSELVGRLNALGRKVIFLGDGVPVYGELLMREMKCGYSFAPAHLSRQRAAAVAILGAEMFASGIWTSAAGHAPTYLRVSQAEREKQS